MRPARTPRNPVWRGRRLFTSLPEQTRRIPGTVQPGPRAAFTQP
ncbi:hypothetical protein BKA14_002212 [Actinoplanes abujensis]|uniref:Uncharacterized protein n=1 Tax=Paractinoplanes abujensis TaxID=882441 RepID=A0A7W7G0Y7_9ACTN|nr:hypothetical protein [Actinoplanes abujensis]